MKNSPNIYETILLKSLNIPGAKVDRKQFLKSNLKKYCSNQNINLAVETTTKNANIPVRVLDKIAKNVIKNHRLKATSASAIAGIPGGFAMIGTIPADLIQFNYHIIVVAQKLSFIYGYPEFEEDADEELLHHLILFVGVMYGVSSANKAVVEISRRVATEAAKRIPRQTLTKTAYYPIIKEILKWMGVKLTKQTFGKSVGKIIPVLGGITSGGLTYFTFTPMANKLRLSLSESFEIRDDNGRSEFEVVNV
jgi:hypothetical protein